MQDAWRAYLELALGLTEASRKKAQKAAKKLVGQSGATAAQLQGMAEELLSTGLANREALVKIIRLEVDRALGKVGLATAEEVADLNARVDELQRRLREAQEQPAAGTAGAESGTSARQGEADTDAAPASGPMTGKATTKAVAKKTVAKKAVVKKVAAKQAATIPPVAAKTVAKKTVAKKTVAKTVAKKSAAKRAVVGETGTRVEAKKLPPPPAQKAARKAARESADRARDDRTVAGGEA